MELRDSVTCKIGISMQCVIRHLRVFHQNVKRVNGGHMTLHSSDLTASPVFEI